MNMNSAEQKLTRSEAREGAFLLLFQMMFGQSLEELDELNPDSFDMAKNEYTDELVKGVSEHDAELCEIIAKYSTKRAVNRIAKVNLVILKIAVYEMTYRKNDVPPKAAINEAMELAKKYSGQNDRSFINGILNSYLGGLNGEKE